MANQAQCYAQSMFVPYLIWSLEVLLGLRPLCYVTALIAVGVIASVLRQKPFGREIWKRKYHIAIVQFGCYPATLLVAAFGAVSGPEPNKWSFRATYALAFISLGMGVYWIWQMKGLRWFAVSVLRDGPFRGHAEKLMFQDDHRAVIADRGDCQSLGVIGGGGNNNFETGNMREHGVKRLGMLPVT